jgi:hypothetical protein
LNVGTFAKSEDKFYHKEPKTLYNIYISKVMPKEGRERERERERERFGASLPPLQHAMPITSDA